MENQVLYMLVRFAAEYPGAYIYFRMLLIFLSMMGLAALGALIGYILSLEERY